MLVQLENYKSAGKRRRGVSLHSINGRDFTLTFRYGRRADAAALLLERAADVDLASYVLVRLEDDDVDLGRVQTDQGYGRAQTDRHAQGRDLCLVGVSGAEVDRHEREPDDARGVHSEADKLALVEVFRDFARLHRVHGRDENQQGVVQLREQEAHVLDVALEYHLLASRIRVPGTRRLDDHPDQCEYNLRNSRDIYYIHIFLSMTSKVESNEIINNAKFVRIKIIQ